MGLLDRWRRRRRKNSSWAQPPIWDLDGLRGAFLGGLTHDREAIENDFEGYIRGALKANGPIFSCIAARQHVFSQGEFGWRSAIDGRRFGDEQLALLENPWPGGTTGKLLSHMEQDASLAGNSFWCVVDDQGRVGEAATGPGRRITRLRPDWVYIVLGSHSGEINALDTRVIGYLYRPPGGTEVLLLPEQVSHYAPIPDPEARFRGMSWLTPVLREIEADTAATTHKRRFFQNAATPNMVVTFDKDTAEDAFDDFVEKFRAGHQGAWNAYKTLFLMGGADVKPLTHDFRQMEFNATVGRIEARIASAAGVPPSWVGFAEGLQGSGLNAGNFSAGRRRFADGTIRPLWKEAAASLETLLRPPTSARLIVTEDGVAFLREDARDRAEIFRTRMTGIDAGIKAGFEADAVVAAAAAEDVTLLLGRHTGLVSVQMQPPRTGEDDDGGTGDGPGSENQPEEGDQ
ncbi:hypothetical protein GCM10027160_29050 [Streptomyces calidiresistens]|uniref:Phage portal protein n=1 Tax=Streptomyces calidiresistens TaxID=1485586 RepID=A0A7W3T0C9_9ACTN|nr:phage portal protein [Streptomyces calidiresistens]MBB0228523.1 phage portal protein [Streptomyces calidiresistens]